MKHIKLYIIFYTLCACVFLNACVPQKQNKQSEHNTTSNSLLRADPGYVQWLEKLSLLGAAQETSDIVSGSPLGWRYPSTRSNPIPLLTKASLWLEIAPRSLQSDSQSPASPLALLNTAQSLSAIQTSGIQALYLSKLAESGNIWGYDILPQQNEASLTDSFFGYEHKNTPTESSPHFIHESVVSHNLDPLVGSDEELAKLQANAARGGLLIGGSILPAATGLGPDFFLGARGLKRYAGAYGMIEVPSSSWHLLPDVKEQWTGLALSSKQCLALAQKGIIPQRLARDSIAEYGQVTQKKQPESLNEETQASQSAQDYFEVTIHAPQSPPPLPLQPSSIVKQGGWAATDAIRGTDGNMRRWVYRYASNPTEAVLHWNDPSAAALRIFATSIIKNVGLSRFPLVGLSLQDMIGLEPDNPQATGLNPEPMLSAANTLAQQIRRYGGWSWLQDPMPTPIIENLMTQGPDFFTSNLGNMAMRSLVQREATSLQAYFDLLFHSGIDTKRLVHILPTQEQITAHAEDSYANTPEGKAEHEHIKTEQMRLMTSFLAAQPGLFIIPAQSIAQIQHGNKASISEAKLQKDLPYLRPLSELRQKSGVAYGTLLARIPTAMKSIALVTALPNGMEYMLTVANTSNQAVFEELGVFEAIAPYIQQNAQNYSMQIAEIPTLATKRRGANIELTELISIALEPYECRVFILTPTMY